MALYRDRQWQAALVLFNRILKRRAGDGPARILMERCGKYLESPPPDEWDGAVHMSLK